MKTWHILALAGIGYLILRDRQPTLKAAIGPTKWRWVCQSKDGGEVWQGQYGQELPSHWPQSLCWKAYS